jgi:large subunit ribosomal protein L3
MGVETKSLLGRKIGMTQVFDEKGNRVGVTVVEAGPCKVLQVKTVENDGYNAIQLGFADKKEKRASLALIGHCQKAQSAPKRFIREVRDGQGQQGDELKASLFEGLKKVDVTGLTKGKGYAGTMKRWNFRGFGASHGCSKRHRAPGALGRHMSINKGVPKGKRMTGHLGQERVTIQGLRLVKIDAEHNLLLIKGAVPGANGDFVIIRGALQENIRLHKESKAVKK